MVTIYLSLGSNIGNRERHLKNAIDLIQQNIGKIFSESSILETEAVGFAGKPFLNQVIKIETIFSPEILLQKTKEIEQKMGRTEKTRIANGQPVFTNRIIDIDILLYDDLKINTNNLTIPHPKMFEREFVMKPLMEIINEE